MKKLKGVCIGAGYFSQFHYEAWKRIPEVEIMAVCDLSIEKARKICDAYGFSNAYNSLEEMLQKEAPDFLDIITPPETHLKFCKLAIEKNVNVICQKPLTPSYEESTLIAKAVADSNIRAMVHENFRFQPWHREIKRLLDKEVIGDKLHTINLRMRMGDGWQEDAYMNRQPYFREMEQLLIYETGIHFIDLFRYFSGEIHQVYAKLKTLNANIKGEDFAWVHFDFVNGMLGFLDANRYNENTSDDPRLTFGNILIEGNKGSLRLYDDGQITLQLLGEKEQKHVYAFTNINFAGDCVYFTQKHFVEQLLNNKPFETGVSSYLKNLKIQNAIYESNERNEVVFIDS
ncbi:Gfo/Idh/MocA family protein [Aquimarina aggregata]|uniref:Gfo/Idh/MocA family protein n=1 Tax=Aquimarina aggregata TaxID=1642818 RepID=UPI00248FE416|nr:Gfo/Idh/MocA family oxidoreductase [Aquimarina aggregata]